MKSDGQLRHTRRRRRAYRTASLALPLLLLALPGAAGAQWATNGNNIHNTNPGNVGVGTSAPEQKFHVDGGNEILSTGAGSGFKFRNRGSLTAADDWVWYSSGNIARFWRAGVGDLLGVTPDGKVGLGTVNPQARLHLASNGLATPDMMFDNAAELVAKNTTGGLEYFLWPRWTDNVMYLNYGSAGFHIRNVDSSVSAMFMTHAGNVGLGTSNPSTRLHVAGDLRVDGNIAAKYQDVAEWVPSSQKLSAGTVVVVDPAGVNHVLASTAAYDTAVAGVVSEQPGLILGEGGEGKVKVATTGRVKVRVDATRAPVKAGDLLVTSDVAGVAMKSEPVAVGGRKIHAPGTIIGKALEPLEKGTGEILVLLSLQ